MYRTHPEINILFNIIMRNVYLFFRSKVIKDTFNISTFQVIDEYKNKKDRYKNEIVKYKNIKKEKIIKITDDDVKM